MHVPAGFFNELSGLSPNERLLLDLIWRHGPITRKSLAAMGGITGASATRLTKKALDLGLIEESVQRTGDVGNPSRPLRRSQENLFSAGIEIDRDSISLALASVEGEIIWVRSIRVSTITTDGLAEFAKEALSGCEELKEPEARLLGVGVAIPGYRSSIDSQWAVHWDFPDLLKVNVEDQLADKLGVPVVAERDAIAAAWAERLNGNGKGRSLDTFCLVYLAQGVGGAVMNDGRPVLGSSGNAGGLGILFPYDRPPRPSTHSLVEYLRERGVDWPFPAELLEQDGSPIDDWVSEVSPNLAAGLDTITRLYDPGTIILGGTMPQAVLKKIVTNLGYSGPVNQYTAPLPVPTVEISALNENSLLIGAASLPVARLLTSM